MPAARDGAFADLDVGINGGGKIAGQIGRQDERQLNEGLPNQGRRPFAIGCPPSWVTWSRNAPGSRATNGMFRRSSSSSASFLCQKWGTSGVWSRVRMVVDLAYAAPLFRLL